MKSPKARIGVVRRAVTACALFAALTGLGACGGKGPSGNQISGRTLTIYASVPLRGDSRVAGEAVLSGVELALAQARGRIGRYRIAFKALDDSTVQRGEWDPGQTTLNARQAVQDQTTIGYIGELNSGASAVSIPLLNRVGIAQISPGSAAVGLTTNGPGAAPGEPDKYYPTGVRTFARVVPTDAVQAAAMTHAQLSAGCTKTYVLDDGEVDGEDTATTFELVARSSGLDVLTVQPFSPTATDYSSLAAGVATSGANCLLISALADTNVVLLTRQLAAALPHAMIFGSAGVAESTYTDPAEGGIPSTLDGRVLITAPLAVSARVASLSSLSSLSASLASLSSVASAASAAGGDGPSEPYTSFGYESMSLMLNAIGRATDDGRKPARRSAVVAAIFATRNRRSVLGTYSIDPNGDTTLGTYGLYRVVAGQLQLWQAMAV